MSPVTITLLALGVAILLAGGVALLGLMNALGTDTDMRERIQAYAFVPDASMRRDAGRRSAGLVRLRLRLNTMLSMLTSAELNMHLLSANWPITVTEFILIRIGVTLAGFMLGWLLFGSPLSGAALAVIAYMAPGFYLRRSIHGRQRRFEGQLVDVLVLVSGAVRAGFSLLQALDVIEREMKAPASEEFRRVRREVGLGLPLGQALDNLSARMQNDDLNLVVTAININYQVGGNLATMLDAVTETIRERIYLFSEVRMLTTQQRYTSYLLTLLPFVVGALLFLMNPGHMSRLFEPNLLCVPIGAVIGIILGNIVLRRMARIDV